jgi:hypothetical protein
MSEIYARLVAEHGIMIVTPVYWCQATSVLKLIFTIALFAIAVAAFGNWRNGARAYRPNLGAIGWADGIRVPVGVIPGYVPLLRRLFPPAIFVHAHS